MSVMVRNLHRVVLPALVVGGVLAGAATAAIGSGASAAPAADLERLAWMAGSWSGESGGVQMEEHWIEPRGGVMLGLHRDLFPDGTSFFEFLRIEQTEQGIVYFASPRGREATPFRLLELRGRRVEFHNPEHDYPQRIVYESTKPDNLCARIEGEQDGKASASEWCWQRRKDAPAPAMDPSDR